MSLRAHLVRALIVGLICLINPGHVVAMAWENTDEAAAFSTGDIAAVKRILAKDHDRGYSGEQLIEALEQAILHGQVELVKYLATRGWLEVCRKAPNCHSVDWATDSVEMLQYLVSKGFPITIDALRSASETGRLQAVEFLCDRGANPHEKYRYSVYDYKQNKSVLHEGTALQMLKESNSYTGKAQWSSENPLRDAQWSAAVVKVAEFIEKGLCRRGVKPSSLLAKYEQEVKALKEPNISVARQLFSPSDADAIHPTVLTYLLYEAIASGSLEILDYLKGIGWLDRCKKTPLCRPAEIAALTGAGDHLFKFLVSEGFEIDWSSSTYTGTPLHFATLAGHLVTVKSLCQQGANARYPVKLNGKSESLLTALRKSYGTTWCALNGQRNSDASGVCNDEPVDIPGPNCVPGTSCLSIRFPPDGPQEAVQKLVKLSEVFHYLRSDSCNPLPNGQCPSLPVGAVVGTVVWDSIRLRSAPDQASTIIRTLKYGQELSIIDTNSDCVTVGSKAGHWVKVRDKWDSSSSEGWVFDAYLDYLPDETR